MQEGLREQLVQRLKGNLAGQNSLRDKQPVVQQDIINYLDNPDNPTYGYIKRPTGTGKTVSFLNAAVAMGERTLIVVPRNFLATDTKKEMLKAAYNLKVDPNNIGIYDSDQSDADCAAALHKKYLITTYSSFSSLTKQGKISPDPNKGDAYFPVIMLDEVHHTRGDVIRPRIDAFLDESLVLGWTASDTFSNGTNVGDEVFRGRKPIHVTSIRDAIEGNEICSFKNILVRNKTGSGQKITHFPGQNFNDEQIESIVNRPGRDEQALNMYANYFDEDTGIGFRGKSAICYCGGIEHAKRLANKFNSAFKGVFPDDITPAVAISGKTPVKDRWVEGQNVDGNWVEAHWVDGRETILRKYKEGKIKVLCNADLLIEGFDAPDASVCFMLAPTASPIVCEQTGGRVLRKGILDRDKFAYIVNMMDEGVEGELFFGKIAGAMQIKAGEMERQKQLRGDRERFDPITLPANFAPPRNMEIISKVDELETIRTAQQILLNLPDKTAEWISVGELCKLLNMRTDGEKTFSPQKADMASLSDNMRAFTPFNGDIAKLTLPNNETIVSAWRAIKPSGKPQLCLQRPSEAMLQYMQDNYGAIDVARGPWKTKPDLKRALSKRISLNEAPRVFDLFWEQYSRGVRSEAKIQQQKSGPDKG